MLPFVFPVYEIPEMQKLAASILQSGKICT